MKLEEVQLDADRVARLLETGNGLCIAIFREGRPIVWMPVKERTTEGVRLAIKEIDAMKTEPDRRLCPVCGKPVATMEQATTNKLILRQHGGSLRPATWRESLGRGPRQKKEGQCNGSFSEMPRIVEVWRARGFGYYAASAATDRDERDASASAEAIVRNGINGNEAAFVQRFDLPTQKWVTVDVVGNKNATYEKYDPVTRIKSVYGINGKLYEMSEEEQDAKRQVVTSLTPPDTFPVTRDIKVTLSGVWNHLRDSFGLRFGSPDVGMNRVELIGSEAQWQKARDYVAADREASKGAERASATTALSRIDIVLKNERLDAAKEWGRQALVLLPQSESKRAAKSAILFAKSSEDVVAAVAAAAAAR